MNEVITTPAATAAATSTAMMMTVVVTSPRWLTRHRCNAHIKDVANKAVVCNSLDFICDLSELRIVEKATRSADIGTAGITNPRWLLMPDNR